VIENVVLSAFTELMDLVVVGVKLSLHEDASLAVILFLFVLISFEVRQSTRVLLGLVVFVVELLLSANFYSAGVDADDWLPLGLVVVLSHVHVLSLSEVAIVFTPGVRGMGE
jgi:hypothetical protein